MKIAINSCYGGFNLSDEAKTLIFKAKGIDEKSDYSCCRFERNDPDLISVIEEIGSERASGPCSNIVIVDIPDDVNWTIEEYDGSEVISEVHRTWQPHGTCSTHINRGYHL